MTTMASQITNLTVVYSTVYSDADQRKQQSSASLAFVWWIHRDRWIPRTKGQLRGKCFHLMTSSCIFFLPITSVLYAHIQPYLLLSRCHAFENMWQAGIHKQQFKYICQSQSGTSNGSWRQGIKGEMTCTVYVALVWNIIYWIMMIITLFTE